MTSGTGNNLGPLVICSTPRAAPPPMSDLSGSNLGDFTHGDSAGGDIYNIVASVDALSELLQSNLERIDARVMALERAESQHANERQSLTRALMVLANESTSVRAVQRQLDNQLSAERLEREQRRRQLDTILVALIAVNAAAIAVRLARRQ